MNDKIIRSKISLVIAIFFFLQSVLPTGRIYAQSILNLPPPWDNAYPDPKLYPRNYGGNDPLS